MSKEKSKGNLHTGGAGAREWETAIRDAEQMISDYKERIDRLNRAIKTFTALRDEGAAFPSGTAKKAGNKAAEATV